MLDVSPSPHHHFSAPLALLVNLDQEAYGHMCLCSMCIPQDLSHSEMLNQRERCWAVPGSQGEALSGSVMVTVTEPGRRFGCSGRQGSAIGGLQPFWGQGEGGGLILLGGGYDGWYYWGGGNMKVGIVERGDMKAGIWRGGYEG